MATPAPEWTEVHEELYRRVQRHELVRVRRWDTGEEFTIQRRCTEGVGVQLCFWYDIKRADGTWLWHGVEMFEVELRMSLNLCLPVEEAANHAE